jgi:TRAP-type C4-dicarboxylate transport system permease small subunit
LRDFPCGPIAKPPPVLVKVLIDVPTLKDARLTQHKSLILQTQRHLKWPSLDGLEKLLMILSGTALAGFTASVMLDIATRTLGRPWLWLQEVTTTFFIYGIFIGAAVATRRNDHLYLAAAANALSGRWRTLVECLTRVVILAVALCMVYYGYLNFLRGFGSFRMPSMTPIASLYAAIPLSGALIALFAVEQIVNGLRHGFEEPGKEALEPALEGTQLGDRGL